ncbi:MAG: efflux RND transporter periplasmic adaptor subunit [Armatimonadota bacterium]
MNWKAIIGVGVIVLAVAGVWVKSAYFSGVEVTVTAAQYRPLSARLSTDGVVESIEVQLSPERAGRLVSLFVDEGAAVETGQTLMTITDEQAVAALEEAEAAYEAAKTQVQVASARLDQAAAQSGASIDSASASEKLQQAQLQKAQKGPRSQEIAQAEASVQSSEAQVEAAQAAVEAVLAAYNEAKQQHQARLSGARASVDSAEAQLQKARQGPRKQEIARAEATLQAANARKENADVHFRRVTELYEQGAAAESQLDDARSAKQSAEAAEKEAAETLGLLKAGTREEDIQAAEARLRQAESTVQQAQAFQKTVEVQEKKLQAARARLKQAEAVLEQNRQYAQMLREGTRIEDIESHEEQVAMAAAQKRAAMASRSDVEAVAHQLQQAAAEKKRAAAGVQAARANLSDTVIQSPITGVVARKYADEGDIVGPTAPVLTLVNNRDVWVIARVDDEDISRVSVGQAVRVLVEAYPDRNLEGEVVRIGKAAEPKGEGRVRAKIVRVKIHVPQAAEILRPGMEVDIETEAQIKQRALLVPADAVIEEPEGTFVYVVESGRAHKREIETGFSSYTETEVTKGLQQGDEVVVSGKDDLEDGIRVSVKESATAQKLEAQQ